MCYTYDSLSRVTARTVKKLSDNSVVSTETFNYDAAGNVTSAPDSSFQYDTNNRLISFNGNTVSYDLDGNMLSNGALTCTYDSANRLVSAGGHTYTYNAEDVRIRNLCTEEDTTYTYDTNCRLSKLVCKTTNGVVTKYVYGKGLIGEEVGGAFKTYHFDCRGSTIAITDASGNITDTFAYDTYGKLISRTGTSKVIFGYNGRDGVVTDDNSLIYMRARYYSPDMRRFVNADIVAGEISNAITLNRFAYANGNPVSFVDPFGLSVERGYKYDRDAAIAYAEKWSGKDSFFDRWLNYIGNTRNTEYYSYSQNCANFVSQCLFSGGIQNNEEWHSYKEFNLNKHLWNILSVVSSNYWYDWDITEAWRLAQKQYEYFSNKDNGFINGEVIKISNVDEISNVIKEKDIKKGDLLYWSSDSGETVHHATMISSVTEDDILYTGNTSSRFDASLSKALKNETVLIVRINDFIMEE